MRRRRILEHSLAACAASRAGVGAISARRGGEGLPGHRFAAVPAIHKKRWIWSRTSDGNLPPGSVFPRSPLIRGDVEAHARPGAELPRDPLRSAGGENAHASIFLRATLRQHHRRVSRRRIAGHYPRLGDRDANRERLSEQVGVSC